MFCDHDYCFFNFFLIYCLFFISLYFHLFCTLYSSFFLFSYFLFLISYFLFLISCFNFLSLFPENEKREDDFVSTLNVFFLFLNAKLKKLNLTLRIALRKFDLDDKGDYLFYFIFFNNYAGGFSLNYFSCNLQKKKFNF